MTTSSGAPRDVLHIAEAARRDGDPLRLHDVSLDAIEAGRPELRFRYLQVLASAQMGDTARAERLYDVYRLGERADDEDCLALRGRLHKDQARAATGLERTIRFRAASRAYQRAYDATGGYFPAINAATTAWAAGDRQTARRLAEAVLARPDIATAREFFAAASRSEALILLGRGQEALETMAAAVADADVGHGERAAACRQLEWLSAIAPITAADATALLGAVRPPPVLVFTGHMFRSAAPDEAALTTRIGVELGRLGSSIAYGALACGADIIIAEEILRRGGELQVVLPFPAVDFIRASVLPGGEAWVDRFHSCLARAAAVTLATRMDDVGDDSQFAYGARLAGGLAYLRSRQICTAAVQLAVWDGQPARGVSGAAVDVEAWRGQGFETRIVEPGPLDRDLAWAPRHSGPTECARATRALIFTDYKGYTRLPESLLPTFNREVMGRIASVLDRWDGAVLARNTWGDAFFGVVADAVTAADITLEIAEALEGVRVGDPAGGDQEGMRIGLHFGRVYQHIDRITGQMTYFGSEVSLTARIEPKVIPGQVYASQAFAAILATAAPGRFATRYLGRLELAKSYGAWPIYRLERSRRT